MSFVDPIGQPPPRKIAPEVFSAQMHAFLTRLPPFATQLDTLGGLVSGWEAAARMNADAAGDSAAIALATANNRGAWSALTGPAAPPASANHAGRAWILDVPVEDVTAHEPGVSAAWVPLAPLGSAPFNIIRVGTDYTAQGRDWVEVEAPGCTVALPADPVLGTTVWIARGDFYDTVLHGNGALMMGEDDTWVFDSRWLRVVACVFVGGSTGWRF
ncbi:MAG: hypothetical protein ACK4KV_18965 [Rhodocyclaceae bacterium]